ncbi:VOC family protein [Microbacterium aoyamense]|uniref:VOC family protein n=1 Tax=Microbacterium aoyamense TaxID=344166 RepID=A0ABN2PG97_9MICO|nr:VOC family protein [Microbacterium aoyamense]
MLRTYPHGVPCWIQLDVADTSVASAFYGELFGWTFADAVPGEPGAYLFARIDGEDAGAIALKDADGGWISFIACDDIDATCAAVERAGGFVADPPDEGSPFGRSATCVDPLGAAFQLWQAGTHPGSQVVNVPGAWNFSDLHTPDAESSLRFYGDIFGWRVDADLGAGMIRLPGYGDHLAATIDPDIHERQAFAPEGFADVIAGLTPDDSSEWIMRFTVGDRDDSAERIESLGGSVLTRADTEWTKEAMAEDPAGARFVISQLSPPE